MIPATLSLGSLRAGYAAGELTPVEVVDAVSRRIAARGDDGVWIALAPTRRAPPRPRSIDGELDRLPLYGIPFVVKDNIDVAGLPTTAGCPAFAYDAGRVGVPSSHGCVAAGAIVVGKTNLDQFATGLVGTRSPVRHAAATSLDPALVPGGSSSGSAVAVAAGLVPFSHRHRHGRVRPGARGAQRDRRAQAHARARQDVGVVPACRSLDCASVFALDVGDAAGCCGSWPGTTTPTAGRGRCRCRRRSRLPAVPSRACGSACLTSCPTGAAEERKRRGALCSSVSPRSGAELTPVPMAPFWEAGDQLYQGVWVAERIAVLEELCATVPTRCCR